MNLQERLARGAAMPMVGNKRYTEEEAEAFRAAFPNTPGGAEAKGDARTAEPGVKTIRTRVPATGVMAVEFDNGTVTRDKAGRVVKVEGDGWTKTVERDEHGRMVAIIEEREVTERPVRAKSDTGTVRRVPIDSDRPALVMSRKAFNELHAKAWDREERRARRKSIINELKARERIRLGLPEGTPIRLKTVPVTEVLAKAEADLQTNLTSIGAAKARRDFLRTNKAHAEAARTTMETRLQAAKRKDDLDRLLKKAEES